MRKTTLALALGAAVALAAPAAFSQHPGPAPAGPPAAPASRGAAARRPGRDPPRRDAPPEPPAAHLRRPERRGLLERGRQEHRLPGDERGRGRDVRPAVRGRRRDREEPHGLERQGPGDLRLLLRRRPARPLRLDPPRRPRLPAARRPLEGLRLADDRRLRHREPRPRRLRLQAPHRDARLRRRGDALAGREDDRLHLRPRRRPRDLHDGDRRDEREAAHPRARLRRRAVLLPRRQAHRLPPRRPPRRGEPRPLQGAPRAAPLPAGRARDLGHERGRLRQAPGDEARRRVLRTVLPPGRPAHHLLEQPPEPPRAQLRPVDDPGRRHRPRAGHHRGDLRRLPDVLAEREAARLREQPRRQGRRARRTSSSPTGWSRGSRARGLRRRARPRRP